MKQDLLLNLRSGKTLSFKNQIVLITKLSLPPIFAQLSSVVMQYIDAGMVGRLGSAEAAAIGLVSSSTWLLDGTVMAINVGFIVLVAQMIGAKKEEEARNLMKQGLLVAFILSAAVACIGALISGSLPKWLGADESLWENASRYFLIRALADPVTQMYTLAAGLLQSTGDMKTPGTCMIFMCALDVVFNYFLIFTSNTIGSFTIPGFGLGVAGAALGTVLAQLVIAIILLYRLVFINPILHVRKGEKMYFTKKILLRCLKIDIPVAIERLVMCGAQIVSTGIVAPLGTISIAAHSFSITAESLCYMPGYGIREASTTIIGQSIGAERHDLTKRLSWLVVLFGMAVMTVTGILMFILAPWMIGILTPDAEVISLGVAVLRMEAFAEPLYAASIVATGVYQGLGKTKIPTILNFISMWAVRVPLSIWFVNIWGLYGVWLAMLIELMVRGSLFLIFIKREKM